MCRCPNPRRSLPDDDALRCGSGGAFKSMARNVCGARGPCNLRVRGNAHPRVQPMSPRAMLWAVCLVAGYWAFLTLLAAVGSGWHL